MVGGKEGIIKGLLFTEFLEMVEDSFSPELADRIIEEADLPSGGVYTAVGTYNHGELIQLISCLSEATGTPASDLLRGFGEYLFGRFHAVYPQYFEGIDSAFDFLQRIDDYIHVEVRKLYRGSELPTFKCDTTQPGRLHLTYRSTRPFALLAEGLVRGCISHYGEPVDVVIEDLSDGKGTAARFVLTRKKAAP